VAELPIVARVEDERVHSGVHQLTAADLQLLAVQLHRGDQVRDGLPEQPLGHHRVEWVIPHQQFDLTVPDRGFHERLRIPPRHR
jgi:hypothetical protein